MTKNTRRILAIKLKPEQRKLLLLNTAVDVFAAKGIRSVKHLAALTVFSYFTTRDVLLNEVLAAVGSYMVEAVTDVVSLENEPQQRLYLSGRHTMAMAKARPNYIRVWLIWGTHFSPELQAQYKIYEVKLLKTLCEIIQPGSSGDDPTENIHDRARMILGSLSYLMKIFIATLSFKWCVQAQEPPTHKKMQSTVSELHCHKTYYFNGIPLRIQGWPACTSTVSLTNR